MNATTEKCPVCNSDATSMVSHKADQSHQNNDRLRRIVATPLCDHLKS